MQHDGSVAKPPEHAAAGEGTDGEERLQNVRTKEEAQQVAEQTCDQDADGLRLGHLPVTHKARMLSTNSREIARYLILSRSNVTAG